MPNYLDNLDVIDAGGNTVNVLLQDRGTLAIASQVSLKVNNLDIYNVKDYGAKGDGTTDDSGAINDCVTAMPNSGAIMFFPSGTYKLDSAVEINKHVSIMGSGANCSKIVVSGSNSALKIVGDYIFIRNIWFEGSRTGNVGLELTGSFLLAEDCIFAHFTNNVFLNGCASASFIKCYIVSSPNGVIIENTGSPDTGDNSFINCVFDSSASTGNGILFHSGGGLRLIGNKFLHYGTQVSIAPASGVSTSVLTCTGNSFEASGTQALQLGGASGSYSKIAIVGNQFAGNPYAIRVLAGASYVKISDNLIEGYGNGACFQLSNCSDVEISDNKVVNVTLGIQAITNVPRLTIQHNDISATTPIALSQLYNTDDIIDDQLVIPLNLSGQSSNLFQIYCPSGGACFVDIEVAGVIHSVGYIGKKVSAILSFNGSTYTVKEIYNEYATNDAAITIANTGAVSMSYDSGTFEGKITVKYRGSVNSLVKTVA